jgi:hypothetical protein
MERLGRPVLEAEAWDSDERGYWTTFYLVIHNKGRSAARACTAQITMEALPSDEPGVEPIIAGWVRDGHFNRVSSVDLQGVKLPWLHTRDSRESTIPREQRERLIVARARQDRRTVCYPKALTVNTADIEFHTDTVDWTDWRLTVTVTAENAEPLRWCARLRWEWMMPHLEDSDA